MIFWKDFLLDDFLGAVLMDGTEKQIRKSWCEGSSIKEDARRTIQETRPNWPLIAQDELNRKIEEFVRVQEELQKTKGSISLDKKFAKSMEAQKRLPTTIRKQGGT